MPVLRVRLTPRLWARPEWMKLSTVCPAPAGSVVMRDVRACAHPAPTLRSLAGYLLLQPV